MMRCLSFISAFALLLSFLSIQIASASFITRGSTAQLRSHYTRTHSLGDNYIFNAREWDSVNVTDLGYKYEAASPTKRSSKASSTSNSIGGTIAHLLNDIWNGLKGLGSSESVKITWYTGHDLLNPSCWSDPSWHPTDDSFACALTLQGWTSHPKCLSFLELCNGPKKCVFVRVVDSCAGCAPGSKHVDLTKAAFSQLADLNEGVLNVQMRLSSGPDTWYEDLWGPK